MARDMGQAGEVYAVRHGETDWNRQGRLQGGSDIPLNEAGRVQAAQLAQRLQGVGIRLIASSPLSRARQTAEIVATQLGNGLGNGFGNGLGNGLAKGPGLDPSAGPRPVSFAIEPGLIERRFGIFEGLTREQCAERYPELWRRYRADPRQGPPESEAYAAMVSRMVACVQQLAERVPDGGGLLIVSHGAALRALFSDLAGKPCPSVANGALFRLFRNPQGLGAVEPLGC